LCALFCSYFAPLLLAGRLTFIWSNARHCYSLQVSSGIDGAVTRDALAAILARLGALPAHVQQWEQLGPAAQHELGALCLRMLSCFAGR